MSLRTRIRILERDGFRCVYCSKSSRSTYLQIDHVQPRALGGSNDDTNLVSSCQDCNTGKAAMLVVTPDWVSR